LIKMVDAVKLPYTVRTLWSYDVGIASSEGLQGLDLSQWAVCL